MAGQLRRVAILGAGVAGLTAAMLLAARGVEVTLLERAAQPGGKIREARLGQARLDTGPTLLTLRPIFEAIFAAAGSALEATLTLHPVSLLARHVWPSGPSLDLFADLAQSAEAIGHFAGAREARGYEAFCARARRIHDTLDAPLLRAQRPSAMGLLASAGPTALLGTSPFATLWDALGEHFQDQRLRQLFARYATYVGASPLLAPATLMLVAHVEQQGVWCIEGGMQRLPEAMAAVAARHGATLRYGTEVREILVRGGRAAGLRLADNEEIPADAVLVNADAAALAAGRFGAAVALQAPQVPLSKRSFSAITWAMRARVSGFPLASQNVVFPAEATAEFGELAFRGRLPAASTIHLSASDRMAAAGLPAGEAERLLCLISAPARGDSRPMNSAAIEACTRSRFAQLAAVGIDIVPEQMEITTPADFEQRFPGTGGALYGPAVHGWAATFARPGARTKLPGLYLAGGSVHPGAGIAMAALSGRLAAASMIGEG